MRPRVDCGPCCKPGQRQGVLHCAQCHGMGREIEPPRPSFARAFQRELYRLEGGRNV